MSDHLEKSLRRDIQKYENSIVKLKNGIFFHQNKVVEFSRMIEDFKKMIAHNYTILVNVKEQKFTPDKYEYYNGLE
jgi:hypothetical protein